MTRNQAAEKYVEAKDSAEFIAEPCEHVAAYYWNLYMNLPMPMFYEDEHRDY